MASALSGTACAPRACTRGSAHQGPPARTLADASVRVSHSGSPLPVSRCLIASPREPRDFRPATYTQRALAPDTSAALNGAGEEEEEEARVAEMVDSLKWDKASGLIVAIAQNADTGEVMMQGFADKKAVTHTLLTGRATFFSRSRKTLWTKGETSGNFIKVLDVYADCDKDSLIYWGLPDGPTCHTGEITCFFNRLSPGDGIQHTQSPLSSLFAVEHTIKERQQEMQGPSDVSKKPSWTQKLLTDPTLLCSKIREEADELCRTLEDGEGPERAASEMADLLYHSIVLLRAQDVWFWGDMKSLELADLLYNSVVLLRAQGVDLESVGAALRSRFGKSGIEEKASRKPKLISM